MRHRGPEPRLASADSPPHRPSAASIKRLFQLARPEARALVAGTFFLALGAAASLSYPQGMKVIIDATLTESEGGILDRAAIGLAIAAIVQGVSIALRYVLFTVAGERVVARLRERLYRSILDQEVAFFDERRTGELTNRLSSDTTVIQSAVSVNISMGLRMIAQVVGGIGFLLYTSPLLTAIMLSVVPPVAIGAVAYGRRIRKLSREVQDALAGASEVAEESIAGIRTVRSFAAEVKEGDRYASSIQGSFELARRRAIAAALFMASATTAGYIAVALVFWYGGRLVVRHEMTPGGLTAFLVYTLMVAFSIGGLADLWADFMKSVGAAERVFQLLDRTPAIPRGGGATLDHPEGRVAIERVAFAYPTRPNARVLQGVDLTIEPGEIVAVVGPSGAGKSTIASLLARLYDPLEGRILFDGQDLRALDPQWLRRQIGTVAQEPILFSTSVAENIRYGRPGASIEEVHTACRAANAHGFISEFPMGYDTLVGERGVQLSGGQKQRVAIARAVLKDPRLLILDEATSALDAESEHLVKEALDRLMLGRTTLVIAHRLSTVIDADRVVVLDAGHVAQVGNHRELMAQEGIYKRLVERQFVEA